MLERLLLRAVVQHKTILLLLAYAIKTHSWSARQ